MRALSIALVAASLAVACGRSAPVAPSPQPMAPAGFGTLNVEASAHCAFDGSASCFSTNRLRPSGGPSTAPPAAPSGLTAATSGSTVTLTWTRPSGGDAATDYVIDVGSAPGLTNLASSATGSTATSFSASGIGSGTYYVRVRAINFSGTSAPSNEVVVVVGGSSCTAPGAPSNLTATSSGSTVFLAWNAGSGSPTSYVIEAGSAPGLANLVSSDLGNASTSLAANGVGAGTYYVRVRAKNACGTSAVSNEVAITVGGTTPTASLTGQWLGVSPDGILVPAAACETAFDLTLALTQASTAVTGTATLRVRTVNPSGSNNCARVGDSFSLPVSGTTSGSTFSLRASDPGLRIDFAGSATTSRMSGTVTFNATTGTGRIDTYSGTFAVNK